jgi:hypothetical protein
MRSGKRQPFISIIILRWTAITTAYRTLLGILRLGKSYTDQRLEAACGRALCIGSASYRSVASILKTGLDSKPLPKAWELVVPIQHHNIRGSQYYMSINKIESTLDIFVMDEVLTTV